MKLTIQTVIVLFASLIATKVKADCLSISNNFKQQQCESINRLSVALGQSGWLKCSTATGEDPCDPDSCMAVHSVSSCNKKKKLIGLSFTDPDMNVQVTDPVMFQEELEVLSDMSLKLITISNQNQLNLSECIPVCASGLECDFNNSSCIGECLENGGVCPTNSPSQSPSFSPSVTPSQAPSGSPTKTPTGSPSQSPSSSPSGSPSTSPSVSPSSSPSISPSVSPSSSPSSSPTETPTTSPTTSSPSSTPTDSPSFNPSVAPSFSPSGSPTGNPTAAPTKSSSPTTTPTDSPTIAPTISSGSREVNVMVFVSFVLVTLFFSK